MDGQNQPQKPQYNPLNFILAVALALFGIVMSGSGEAFGYDLIVIYF